MSIFKKALNFITGDLGSLGTKIVNTISGQLPEKISEEQKANINLEVEKLLSNTKISVLQLANEQEKEYNNRLKDMEGTASDLKQFGFIGKIIILLRGAQRPTWGYFTLYMDANVFSGKWNLLASAREAGVAGEQLISAFWIVNLMVLIFLFGERAAKNLIPLLKVLYNKYKESKP